MNLYINVNELNPIYFSITSYPLKNPWMCTKRILVENIDLEIEGIRSHYTPERVYDLIRKIFNKMCTASGMELREIPIRNNLKLFSITKDGNTLIYGLQLKEYTDSIDGVIGFDRFVINYINEVRSEVDKPNYHGYIDIQSKHLSNQIAALFTI